MNARFLNLVLLAVCLGLLGSLIVTLYVLKTRPGPTMASEPMVVTNSITQTQIAVRKVNGSNLLAALSQRAMHWSNIESTNYQVYITNLRTIGCPEETIRDIILTDLAKLYGRRRAAVMANEPYRYWMPTGSWNSSRRASPEIQ